MGECLQRAELNRLPVEGGGAGELCGGPQQGQVETRGAAERRCLAGEQVEPCQLAGRLRPFQRPLGDLQQCLGLLVGVGKGDGAVMRRQMPEVVIELVDRQVGEGAGSRLGGVPRRLSRCHLHVAFG